jgi:DNA helicase-2/ATP-dependent DNA helicase PcrA
MLDTLNNEQLEAVLTDSPAVLCVAGPGTGKTRTLTTRVAHLLETGMAHPTQILCLTFTNKAAAEMRDRIGLLADKHDSRRVSIGTFHSICLGMIRQWGDRLGYMGDTISVYDEVDRADILKAVMADLKTGLSMKVLDIASTNQSCRAMPDDELDADTRRVFAEYRARLKASNAVDFNLILLEATRLLRDNPDVLEYYRNLWRYVFVDEYQDTDRVQYNLHHLLQPANLFCIGDPDQSIYGFRGADQSIILQFEQDHPGAKIIRLTQNYRSTKHIVDGSMALIKHNINRIDNEIVSERPGVPVVLVQSRSQSAQAAEIARNIKESLTTGSRYSDNAVLYRKHASAAALIDAFKDLEVPYQVLSSERNFYGIDEVHRFISLLRLIANPADNYSFGRVVNWPTRQIDAPDLRRLHIGALEAEMPIFEYSVGALEEFHTKTMTLHMDAGTLPVTALADKADEKFGLSAHFRAKGLTTRASNIRALIEKMREWCCEAPAWGLTLTAWLEWFALRQQQDALSKSQDSAKLLTIHAAKGLEWDNVYIVDATEHDHLPGRKDEDTEEERRIFYVAATRARDLLYMSYPREKVTHGGQITQMLPVRFADEVINQ